MSMKRLKLASSLMILGLGMWVGPSDMVLAQSPGLTSAQQASELAQAEQLKQQVLRLYQQRKYDEAVPLAEESLSIFQRILGDRYLAVADSLVLLALLYAEQDRYKDAESLYIQALGLVEKSTSDQLYPLTLYKLAILYVKQGRYKEAKPLYGKAFKLYNSLPGEHRPVIVNNLNDLGSLYRLQGLYKEAELLYAKALEMRKSNLNESSSNIAISLDNLATIYTFQSRYDEAESLYKQALQILRSYSIGTPSSVSTSLNNLAALYIERGQYEKAEPLYLEALEIVKSTLGEQTSLFATSLNGLAVLYDKQRQYEKAELRYVQSLKIFRSIFKVPRPELATSLSNLAAFYTAQKRYKEAESLHVQALEMNKLILRERHPNIGRSLNNLAVFYERQELYEKAEPLFLEALDLWKSSLGERHPNVPTALNNLARLYASQGHYEKAIDYLEQSLSIEEENVATNLPFGPEGQKYDYLETVRGSTYISISLHLQHTKSNSKSAKLSFATILLRKGRILNTLTDRLKRIRQDSSPTEQSKLDQLEEATSQFTNLYHNGLANRNPEQYRLRSNALQQEITQLSTELSRSSSAFQITTQPITLETIQDQIPPDTALVEFVEYQRFNFTDKSADQWGVVPYYAAYILTRSGTLKAIDLGPIQPINEALTLHRQNLQDNNTPIPQLKATARNLDALLMQPIRQHLGNTRNLLLSPDSALNFLPFETLVDENNNYLLETHTITYLTSGRDLQRLTTPKANNNPTLILADPYFGKPGTLATTRTLDLTKQTFPPLSGTRTEAIALGKLLNTQPLLGTDATETAIKQTKSPKILHIATHGFFTTPPEATKTNPLLNSGLVLAGFQLGKSGNDDGILTALEVSNLNLTNTKLVTLSACETGLGTTSNGEGIYGLRRALTIAGAESQVISLWKVSDDATKDLMINYYTRLNQGEGRSIALHNAQRDMLKSKDYAHPYYWAAFIPSGDWRPLNP